jgi:hypothetical protein
VEEEEEAGAEADRVMDVVGIVRRKVVFANRPQPIVEKDEIAEKDGATGPA